MRAAFWQLHVAVFLAGFTAVLGKWIKLNEGLLVWYRIAITVLAMLLLFWYQKKLQKLSMDDAFRIFLVGGIVAFHWVFFYGSIKYANISVALVCFSASGFFTACMEPLILRRKFNIRELLLGLLTIVGIGIIFKFYPEYKLGIFLGIISALGSGIFPIYNKMFLQKHSAQTVMVYEMGGGLLFLTLLLPLYLMKFPAAYYIPTVTDWGGLIVLALVCTVWAIQLQLSALQKISPFTANLTYSLEPVYGIILAFLFFRENKYLGLDFLAGASLIILAIGIQTYGFFRKRI